MSSFFDEASLVFIPSGYKTSKAYSVKPTDGSGDLTFSRSNDTATRVGPDGLIEKVRTNLLTYSNTFSDAIWTKLAASVTGGQTGYDGSSNAWLLENNSGTTTTTRLQQTISASSSLYTFSIYAKAGTTDVMRILIYDGAISGQSWFNFTTESFANTASLVSTFAESVGGGWYRISITSQSVLVNVAVYPSITSGSSLADAGDNIYIQNAQAETGDIATDYIATTSAAVSVGPVANVPRLDYLNSSCPRLLLEPQRTNLISASEDFNASLYNYVAGVSRTSNQTTSPDGYVNADLITEDGTNGAHRVGISTNLGSAGLTTTMSVFAKANGRDWILLSNANMSPSGSTYFNIAEGYIGTQTATNAKIEDYGNGWYRCSITYEQNKVNPYPTIYLTNANGVSTYQGDGTSGVYLYGYQIEQSASYPSSYVPTLGAAVTRGADAAYKTGISSLIGQTEGTIYWEGEKISNVNFGSPLVIDNGILNRIYLVSSSTGFRVDVTSGGTSTAFYSGTQGLGNYKIAIAYSSAGVEVYINGVSVFTDSSVTIPACQNLYFSNWASYTEAVKTSQALLFKTRLTNAQLAELTTI